MNLHACWLPIAALLVALPSHALYKVVGPDGRVTYTDTPPVNDGSKVTPLGANNPPPPTEVSLPLELRQAVARYPVTLYTASNCQPCETARRVLRERGVPFGERTITSNEDIAAYSRVAGGTDLPGVTIGAQALRGLSQQQWDSYLDAAGYPRSSQLPQNYKYSAAMPLVERKEVTPPPRAATAPAPAPVGPPPTAGGFRF